jgi:ABC-type polysaccharide/polyol phosphate export permease
MYPTVHQISLALSDMAAGARAYRIWFALAWQEIRQRYRRSSLGPLWLTISTGLTVTAMGPLYSRLFGQEISQYFPYLTTSFIVWLLLSSLINDACDVFIASENVIKQVKLPLTLHVLRSVAKNLVIFGHNLVIVAAVLVLFPPPMSWSVLLVFPGLVVIAVNGVFLGHLLGIASARYRDIPPIIGSIVQVAFFLTPVMWQKEMLGENRWVAEFNPLFHLLELVRQPLLGRPIQPLSWWIAGGVTVVGAMLSLLVFARFRARIAYWV